MGILESVVLVLVIGFTVTLSAFAIIQKINDESRHNSNIAVKQIGEIIKMIPKVMSETYNELEKRGEA